jgi:hypothetical protein
MLFASARVLASADFLHPAAGRRHLLPQAPTRQLIAALAAVELVLLSIGSLPLPASD